ncbi:MFS transporter [Kitasatospora sp. NPDC057692]|uniref:MFS transporter n=1 Tax=Kitasatospora sp. NPDC057692 TaxID=3346215 RepID=UPI00369EC000
MGDSGGSAAGWSSLAPLVMGTFVVAVEGSILTGVLPRVSADLGLSAAGGGQALAVYPLVCVFGAPAASVLMGGRSQRDVCTFGLLLFAFGNLVTAASTGLGMLIAGRLVSALGACCYQPGAAARAARLGPRRRGRALSVLASGLTMATIVGAPLGVWASAVVTWRQILVLLAVLAVVVALVQRSSRLPGGALAAAGMRERAAFLGDRRLLSVVVLSFVVVAGEFVVYAYLSLVAGHVGGQESATVARTLMVFGVGTTLGTVVGGAAVDALGWRTVLVGSMGGMTLCLFLLPLARTETLLCAVLLGWGVTGWSFTPAQTCRLLETFPDHGPMLLTFNASAVALGVSGGGLFGGYVLGAVGVARLPLVAGATVALALAGYLFRPGAGPSRAAGEQRDSAQAGV